jgi:hypothetical protein
MRGTEFCSSELQAVPLLEQSSVHAPSLRPVFLILKRAVAGPLVPVSSSPSGTIGPLSLNISMPISATRTTFPHLFFSSVAGGFTRSQRDRRSRARRPGLFDYVDAGLFLAL